MGDGSVVPRLANMKALLGLIAGAGASYGLYKLLSGQRWKKNKKSTSSESSQSGEMKLQPGSLLARVSGLDVICPRSEDAAAGRHDPESFCKYNTATFSYPFK